MPEVRDITGEMKAIEGGHQTATGDVVPQT
jgi:hypothetical protein